MILISAEDDADDTIRPRLDAAQADVQRITMLQGITYSDSETNETVQDLFSLQTDLGALECAIESAPDCRLVIIDPMNAYLGGASKDSFKDAEMRRILAPLAKLAADYRVAILAVTHLNKNSHGPAIYRAMGSIAFVAAARAVWAVAKDKNDPRRRLMLPVKANLSADVTGLAYSFMDSDISDVPMLSWDAEPVEVSADDALGGDRHGNEDKTEVEYAMEWLREALADGPVDSPEILKGAKENGISEKTLRRAYRQIGGKAKKWAFKGGWYWESPIEDGQGDFEDDQDGHGSDVATFGPVDHLRSNNAGNDVDSVSKNSDCPHCRSTEFAEVPIRDGESIRRDCARCGRFIDFQQWDGNGKG